MQVFFPFGKFFLFFKIKIGIVRQTWRLIGWSLILMNDSRKPIVDDINYLYLIHIPLVILRSTGAKHTLRSYSLL